MAHHPHAAASCLLEQSIRMVSILRDICLGTGTLLQIGLHDQTFDPLLQHAPIFLLVTALVMSVTALCGLCPL